MIISCSRPTGTSTSSGTTDISQHFPCKALLPVPVRLCRCYPKLRIPRQKHLLLLSASEFLESSDLLIVTEATFFLEDFSLSSADFSFSDFVSSAFSGVSCCVLRHIDFKKYNPLIIMINLEIFCIVKLCF